MQALWPQGLTASKAVQGIAGEWLTMDGTMTNALLGRKQMGKNPTDRGQIGTKRRVLTAGGGLPGGMAVAGAHRNDFQMVRETLCSIPITRPTLPPGAAAGMCPDQGDDDEVRELVVQSGFTAHIRARGEESKALKQTAGFKARRGAWSARRVG